VTIIRDDSLNAARLFSDGGLDWVHIDADHSYAACKADIEAWAPKVKIGGVVAGHDYTDMNSATTVFGVKQAVNEYIQRNNYSLRLSVDANRNILPTWYFVKDH
jgi:hypothetical protein